MDKRGQGISIDVIIIAAIALMVLVVLSIIFLGRMGLFANQSGKCVTQGGKCADEGVSCGEVGSDVEQYPSANPSITCDEGRSCCIKIQ